MFKLNPLNELDIKDMFDEVQRSRNSLVELGWLTTIDWRLFYHHYQSIIAQRKIDIFAIRVGTDYAGQVEINDCVDHYVIGYWLGENYRRKGLATQAMKQVLDRLDGRDVIADTLIENLPSAKVLERLGFKLEKTNKTHNFYRLTRYK